MPGRDRGDLHMADDRKVLLEPAYEIAADDLRVIEIELHAQVFPLDLGDDVGRVLGAGEEIVRPVARIERLDQERDVLLRRSVRRAREIPDQRGFGGGPLLGRHLAGQHMDLAAADRHHIGERLLE